MKKAKKPCLFCKGFKLNRYNLILIVLVCLLMYWANALQIRQIDAKSLSQSSSKS